MAREPTILAPKRYAVVTGANKGIGYEICRQLASNGILVVLTARDEKRGLDAVQKLKDSGISDDLVVYHQLDVVDPDSIVSLAEFVKNNFGKLDILVNNAGVGGVALKAEAFQRAFEQSGDFPSGDQVWAEIGTQNYEMAEQCVKTNYYGARGMAEALAPLLQLSDSPRIVNVTSVLGLLKNIPNEWAKGLLDDVENLNEDRLDEVVNEFLKDFKEDLLESKGWPTYLSAYVVAKAAMSAYTRILAKKYPSFRVNCLCPGYCKTDITTNTGVFTAAEGAEYAVRLALLSDGGPSGCFFYQKQKLPCF
ncbi:(+)-NEOMENTHOL DEHYDROGENASE [Salix purpurea]|uniref:Short-chain dehydrogenase/reductase n=1 Tax=Salix purpurea TaxID=77065 RepID=A0A9Q0PDF1_SALPP|nr:(+)-NEOMENTHOL DEHYDROGENASE [Salix purpurea]